jgi:competence protein ComEC
VSAPSRRSVALGGAVAGLSASPFAEPHVFAPLTLLALGLVGGIGLVAIAPGRRGAVAGAWLALLAASGALAGLGLGAMRLAAIEAGAYAGEVGSAVDVRGFVTATPHREEGKVALRVSTSAGRLLVEAREPLGDVPVGSEVEASGTLRRPRPWEAGFLARAGIGMVLDAPHLRVTGRSRGGLAGFVDGVRDRASAALGAGTPPAGAELLRGFVLGEDDRIDDATVQDFRRSGLAHLLAVSGENIALLALLAVPILALLGVPLRARLTGVLALIGLYVLVTGAGASIQRAGAMGAAVIFAALAGRPRSRWYVVLLAAFATLIVNPLATGDPGWQLSFAAVAGIMLMAAPIRDSLLPGRGRHASPIRRLLAEGAGVTVSATLATTPLIAIDFGTASLTTLPANLLALPAVAPVMWLGMLVAALGQVPGLPVEPLTALAGALAGYVAQVAHWLGSPPWAQVTAPPAGVVLPASAVGAAGLVTLIAARRRRRHLRPRRASIGALAVLVLAVLAVAGPPSPGPGVSARSPGLRVIVLDVGQGDAILLDPAHGAPILVDGGPRGDEIASKLAAAGVSRLAAALVTHDQSDHARGIEDLLGSFPVDRLLYGIRPPRLLREARWAGADAVQVAEGSTIASGRLHLEILWPPRELERGAVAQGRDPNTLALVAIARWRGFSILLTADAEAEQVPLDPGPVDVLKVAHHGSVDAGLERLLDRSAPRLAVISVGAGNPYGHPTPETLATLAAHRVPVLRTDLDGAIEIDVDGSGWSVRVPRS